MNTTKHLAILALLCALGTSTALATPMELVVNGGFETGDFTGWTQTVNVVVSPLGWLGVSPRSGSQMAVLSPLGVLDADLAQQLSIDSSHFSQYEISFAYRLQALDASRFFDFGTDSLEAVVGGVNLLSYPLNDAFGGGVTDTGWLIHTLTVSAANLGNLTVDFQFHVENFPPGGGDPGQTLVAYIDDVSILATPIPEPGTLILVCLGLAVYGSKRIRRSL